MEGALHGTVLGAGEQRRSLNGYREVFASMICMHVLGPSSEIVQLASYLDGMHIARISAR